MSRKDKLIADLRILSTIGPGQTLSSSTMTVIDHKAWSTALWRNYTRENRTDTLRHIKEILNESVTVHDLFPSNDLREEIRAALLGVSNLKETYKGDYYTLADIDRTINNITAKINLDDDEESSQDDEILDKYVERLVKEELIDNNLVDKIQEETKSGDNNDESILTTMMSDNLHIESCDDSYQKISSREDTSSEITTGEADKDTSNSEEMVASSDRKSDDASVGEADNFNIRIFDKEDSSSLSFVDVFRVGTAVTDSPLIKKISQEDEETDFSYLLTPDSSPDNSPDNSLDNELWKMSFGDETLSKKDDLILEPAADNNNQESFDNKQQIADNNQESFDNKQEELLDNNDHEESSSDQELLDNNNQSSDNDEELLDQESSSDQEVSSDQEESSDDDQEIIKKIETQSCDEGILQKPRILSMEREDEHQDRSKDDITNNAVHNRGMNNINAKKNHNIRIEIFTMRDLIRLGNSFEIWLQKL